VVILYLDTSSLLKLYLEEEGSPAVRAAISQASRLTASLITYTEARAGLARSNRAGTISTENYRTALGLFEGHWNRMAKVEVSEKLVRHAGDLAERHELRGYDAMHLAAALWAKQISREQIWFHSGDADLLAAAGREGPMT
jgi:predicted nucleic acid-binding protein